MEILGTVHNSIVVQVDADRWRELGQACIAEMVDTAPLRRLGL